MAAGGVGGGNYSVTVNRKEVVAAALPLQDHWLPLSNLDLLLPPVDVSVFFCYEKPGKPNGGLGFASMVRTLKKSLAQTLVTFYAFAGEVVNNSVGEPELLCNNRGVDFMEAYADVELRELELYNPDASVEGKLVPKKKDGVLCIQVCLYIHKHIHAHFHLPLCISPFLVSLPLFGHNKKGRYHILLVLKVRPNHAFCLLFSGAIVLKLIKLSELITPM